MKKFFTNKKVLAATALALVVAAAGATYAWFTQDIQMTANGINLGVLHVDVDEVPFGDFDPDRIGEPGLWPETTKIGYSIELKDKYLNRDMVPAAFVRVNSDATVKLYDQSDLTTVVWDGPINKALTPFTVDPQYAAAFDADGKGAIWFKDSVKGDYYLLIESGFGKNDPDALEAAYFVAGVDLWEHADQIGNEYQGAEFSFGGDWKATQAMEVEGKSSLEDVFGVTMDDLEMLDGDIYQLGNIPDLDDMDNVGVQSFGPMSDAQKVQVYVDWILGGRK